MDSGHSRGDRRPDRAFRPGRWPEEPDEDLGWAEPAAPAEPDAVAAPGRHARRSAARGTDSSVDTGEWLRRADSGHGDPSEFDVAEYRQRLFSGPGSQLYGMGGGGFERFDDTGSLDGPAGSDRFEGAGPFSGPGGFDHSGGLAAYAEYPDESAAFAAFAERSLDDEPASRDWPAPSPVPRQASGETGTRGVEPESPMESSGLVRPYFRTRGRTRPAYDLALEALVQTSERGRHLERVRVPEHRSICGLCLDTRSVAEVAALLRLPLGVVRVLVGDVAGLGLVLVHSADSMVGDRPSIEFMERVLSGLRRL